MNFCQKLRPFSDTCLCIPRLAFFWASFSKLRILVPRNQQSVFFEAIPACASRREKASEAL